MRRRFEIADVADVQQVETAVGERDGPAGRAVGGDTRDELVARRISPMPVGRPCCDRCLAQLVALTVAVPRFITTRPPA